MRVKPDKNCWIRILQGGPRFPADRYFQICYNFYNPYKCPKLNGVQFHWGEMTPVKHKVIYIIYNPTYQWFSGAHLVGNCPATSKISPKELRRFRTQGLLSIESWQFNRHSYNGIQINSINYKQRVFSPHYTT